MGKPLLERPKPIVVQRGQAIVRVYPRPAERGRQARWMIADRTSGKRKWRTYDSLKEAKAEALRIVALAAQGDVRGAGMTGDERRDLDRATNSVAPFNVDVPTACVLFAEAAALVGAHSIVAACREYARRTPAAREPIPLSKAADDYFESKRARGRSPRLLQDIRSRVGRFAYEHPSQTLQEQTTASVQAWLDKLKTQDNESVAPNTRKNFATVLGGFFEHFRKRGVLSVNPCADLERDSGRRTGGIQFWTPDEAAKLLEAAPEVAKAAAVVGLYCGVRTAELCRIQWRDVNLEAAHVEIGHDIAKTASRRLVPIPGKALAMLKPLKGANDALIYPEHHSGLPKRISEACAAAGIRRIKNGLRHTWVSYRVALTGDVSRVALEAGNSPGIIHGHYRGLATTEQAERYFNPTN